MTTAAATILITIAVMAATAIAYIALHKAVDFIDKYASAENIALAIFIIVPIVTTTSLIITIYRHCFS